MRRREFINLLGGAPRGAAPRSICRTVPFTGRSATHGAAYDQEGTPSISDQRMELFLPRGRCAPPRHWNFWRGGARAQRLARPAPR